MEFKQTYRHEVYLSRKDRARRALFAAKLTGMALALTIGATLRAEPELRRALFGAGMDGVASFANLQSPDVATSALPPQTGLAADANREASDLPTSHIKINRPVATPPTQTTMAEQLDRALVQAGRGN